MIFVHQYGGEGRGVIGAFTFPSLVTAAKTVEE
jgi:hypothetical protein